MLITFGLLCITLVSTLNGMEEVVQKRTAQKEIPKPLTIFQCSEDSNDRLTYFDDELPLNLATFAQKARNLDSSNITFIHLQNPEDIRVQLHRTNILKIIDQKIVTPEWLCVQEAQVLFYTAKYLLARTNYLAVLAESIMSQFPELTDRNITSFQKKLIPIAHTKVYSVFSNKITIKNERKNYNTLKLLTSNIITPTITSERITEIVLDNIFIYAILPQDMQTILNTFIHLKSLQLSRTKLVTIEKNTFDTPPAECIIRLTNNPYLKHLPGFPYTWENGILIIENCPRLTAESKEKVHCTFPFIYELFPFLKPAGFQTFIDTAV